jgi:ribosomal protein S18 acetylase RimI-like enzyme
MAVREFKLVDAEEALALWRETGIFYKPWDKKENLTKKFQKEPDLFLVYEEGKKIVGTVLGQYDGWGAYIHHLATTEDYGEMASALIKEMERRLKKKGAKTVFLFTFPNSKESAFAKNEKYKHWGMSQGWEKKL